MKIVFRVDSSINIGTGHIMRCLTLAQSLKVYTSDITFICRDLEGNLMQLIEENGFIVHSLPSMGVCGKEDIEWYRNNWDKDSEEVIKFLLSEQQLPDLLIVDHYAFDNKWEEKVKEYTNKIMVIDDLANRHHYCDILLDQNFYLTLHERYKGLVPSNCRLLLGPDYVLLREEFFKVAQNTRIRNGEIRNILVFFGGTDPTNETMKTLNALALLENNFKVNIVVGASNKRKNEIREYCNRYPNFFFYCQVSNMAELMNEADLAIGAGGTTTWERCYLGLPSITIIVADNQVELTNAVSKFGATINLGFTHEVTSNQIFEAVKDLIKHPKKVQLLSERASKLVNHEIVNTYPVVKAIMEELK